MSGTTHRRHTEDLLYHNHLTLAKPDDEMQETNSDRCRSISTISNLLPDLLITLGVEHIVAEGLHKPRRTEHFQHMRIYHLCMMGLRRSNHALPDVIERP